MEGGGRSSRSSPVVRESPPSSPSFNSYSSPTANLAEIAARVVEEFRHETNHDDMGMGLGLGSEYMFNDDVSLDTTQSKQQRQQEDEEEDEEEEFEFEFAVLCNNNNNKKEEEYYTCTADHIFFNGQIKPFYPLFNTDLLFHHHHHTHDAHAHAHAHAVDDENKKNNNNCSTTTTTTTTTASRRRNSTGTGRGTLGKLMMEERESSLSSSEADDLDTLQPGTYCVWTPNNKKQQEQGSNNKKSCNSSTGSSKRWNKLRELLLYRSNSGGGGNKDSHSHRTSFVLFTPPTSLHSLSHLMMINTNKIKINNTVTTGKQEQADHHDHKKKPSADHSEDAGLLGWFIKK